MKEHGPLRIQPFIDPNFQENGYLLWTVDGPDAWIIDPGLSPATESLLAAARERSLILRAVVLTHCHFDHIAGLPAVREACPDALIFAPEGEGEMLTDPGANLSLHVGMPLATPPADRTVAPGETLSLGDLTFQTLDVRGHSPGGLAYHCAEAGVVFCGDALFAGNMGRTDFPGGSMATLVANLRDHLLVLPGQTIVYSGHGPPTTIARERESNPFL